jgi:serine/threonine-protein kinase RsbW
MHSESRTFAATLDSLEPIRQFVSEKSLAAGLDKKKNYALCLAIDEIATNIIKYGYPLKNIPDGEGKIEVSVSNDADALTIVLQDSAIPFNPLQHLIPNEQARNTPLEDRPIGGLGIMIARQSVNKFDYEYKDNFNRNIFVV